MAHGEVRLEFGDRSVTYSARVSCHRGYVAWGHSLVVCEAGVWSRAPAQCRPLSCGRPPALAHAAVALRNGSTLWRDEAVYTCTQGYLMVVNESSGEWILWTDWESHSISYHMALCHVILTFCAMTDAQHIIIIIIITSSCHPVFMSSCHHSIVFCDGQSILK